MKAKSILVVALVFIAAILSADNVAVGDLSFTNPGYNDPTSFEDVGLARSLNDSGTVAFHANYAGGAGIYTGSGGALTTIVTGVGDNGFSMNNGGTVVFREYGLYSGNGGAISTILYGSGAHSPIINDEGTVAFWAGDSIGKISGGQVTTVADATGGYTRFDPPGSMNNNGDVAFVGTKGSWDTGGEYLLTGNGGPLTVIADNKGEFSHLLWPSINDAGTVVFEAALASVPDTHALYTASGGVLSVFADVSGGFAGFGNPPSINNAGEIAFLANLDTGERGLFMGPDPLNDKVICTGDALFGSTLTLLRFMPEGLNDLGQVAFQYELANGIQGIAVGSRGGAFTNIVSTSQGEPPDAIPVPLPSAVVLGVIGFGYAGLRLRRGCH